MTLSISNGPGTHRIVTDRELVADALAACGLRCVNPRFIEYWLRQGKTLNEILVIAGEQPRSADEVRHAG